MRAKRQGNEKSDERIMKIGEKETKIIWMSLKRVNVRVFREVRG